MSEHTLDTGCGDPDHDRRDRERREAAERAQRQLIPTPIEWLVFIDAIKERRADE
ncbi:hypothetical protein AB0M47_13820 [Hamadaea sp. NPDC051192]|uniref:hypothetical protein n=1 Tax=Hamadaea sp. NPDC051192 TaxID=3154940 RepID=UPI00344542C2